MSLPVTEEASRYRQASLFRSHKDGAGDVFTKAARLKESHGLPCATWREGGSKKKRKMTSCKTPFCSEVDTETSSDDEPWAFMRSAETLKKRKVPFPVDPDPIETDDESTADDDSIETDTTETDTTETDNDSIETDTTETDNDSIETDANEEDGDTIKTDDDVTETGTTDDERQLVMLATKAEANAKEKVKTV
jgi:hypothetical protein